MDIESIRELCNSLPAVTEDIKWGHDLCFSVGKKMFCVAGLSGPFSVSLKVKDEEFEELCGRPGISIAPYVGRYKWILVTDASAFSGKQWTHYVKQSYELIRDRLPGKIRKKIGLP